MSSHHSSTNDPRQPSTAKPYIPPTMAAQDAPFDFSGFLALIFAVTGLMFRYKANLWLALICCAKSLVNMKNIENDFKQISMAMMFSIMGLVTYYFQPYRSVAPQS